MNLQDKSNKGYLNEQVYHSLKNNILRGNLKPGQRLVETKLAEQFDISRTPIREALNRLKQEGIIYSSTNGLFVSELSLKDLEEIFGLRKVLESYAVELTVDKISPPTIVRFEGLLKEAEIYLKDEFFDLDKILELNTKFHDMIYETSENSRLKRIIGELQDSILRYRVATLHNQEEAEKSIKRHRNIFEALKVGDKSEAKKRIVEDVMQAKMAVLDLFKQEEMQGEA